MRLVIDIEANGLDEIVIKNKKEVIPEVTTIWCVVTKDVDTGLVSRFGPDQIHDAVRYMNTADMLIAHNGIMYDYPVLERLTGIKLTPKLWDTLVVSRCLFPDRQNHKLSSYASNANSLEAWGNFLGCAKGEFSDWSQYSDEMMDYCEQDVQVTCSIFWYQELFVEDNKKWVTLEMLATEQCADMKGTGFGYDLEAGQRLEFELLATKAEIEDELHEVFPPTVMTMKKPAYYEVSHINGATLRATTKGEVDAKRKREGWRPSDCEVLVGPPQTKTIPFNPGSRPQIADRLRVKYRWQPTKQTKGGSAAVDEEVLRSLHYPEAKLLVTYFKAEKLLGMVSDWNNRASLSRDGRIHGSINVQGAVGGRCTHSQPNVSQVDKDTRARSLWVSGFEGEVLIGCDLEGLELRLLAHYLAEYDNGAYSQAILTGDIHSYNQELAGLETRDQAKTFIYALIYGAQDRKLGEIVGGGVRAGSRMRGRFEQELPALVQLQQAIDFQVNKVGSVTMIDGRTVPVRKRNAALNLLLQGSGGILSKLWMVIAGRRVAPLGVKQVAYVHDELQYTSPIAVAGDAANIIEAAAAEAGERFELRIPMSAVATIGSNWSETH